MPRTLGIWLIGIQLTLVVLQLGEVAKVLEEIASRL